MLTCDRFAHGFQQITVLKPITLLAISGRILKY